MVLTLYRLKHYLKYLLLGHTTRLYHRYCPRKTAMLTDINESASSSTDRMFFLKS